jgi:protein-tyrosine phosphatase
MAEMNVDIHSHILWEMDDGPASIEESLAMLRAAEADGTSDIVATPHSNARYKYNPELVRRRIEELTDRISGPKIHRGCELHLSFDNLDQLLRNPFVFTVNGGPYVLLECPDFHVGKHTESILERLIGTGITPILAHPERNSVLQRNPDRLERWIELGCLAQVTALSLTGAFGSPPKTAGFRYLDAGLAHVIASDSHDPERRHPMLSQARQAVEDRLGVEIAELLFTVNPRAVVEGRAIPAGKLAVGKKNQRWRFPFH